jgi:hypothetical protein
MHCQGPEGVHQAAVKEKGRVSSSVFLHLDNAPMHSVKLAQEDLKKRGVQVLDHAPYSPNLAPVDFSLFPKP